MATNSRTQITPQQRAANFNLNTRQHINCMGAQTLKGSAQNISFLLPKVRLLQGIMLECKGSFKIKGDSSGTFTSKDPLWIYQMIRRVSLDYNNGFNPVVLTGKNLALMNLLDVHGNTTYLGVKNGTTNRMTTAAFVDGVKEDGTTSLSYTTSEKTVNFKFYLSIPVTLNQRDPVGLILAQNQETNINLSIDTCVESDLNVKDSSGKNLVTEIVETTFTPAIYTFSIPSSELAFPDISVLKILTSTQENLTANSSNIIQLPTGLIYRKMLFSIVDEDGKPMAAEDISSPIELVFNTADSPYSITTDMLIQKNIKELGYPLPDGIYAFDLSNQGISNYGSTRDYIDTETITSFTMRFHTTKPGMITVISEQLSRVIGG